jgi:DNA mismatch endonuclease (patch repair protein)
LDKVSKEKRSQIMSLVKGKNTKPELMVRKYLFANGFRFRIHDKSLPGTPDIKLTKYKTVIFINGCFWHGHICKSYKKSVTNTDFWENKICNNIIRDDKNVNLLIKLGWKVLIIWECELKKSIRESRLEQIIKDIKNNF